MTEWCVLHFDLLDPGSVVLPPCYGELVPNRLVARSQGNSGVGSAVDKDPVVLGIFTGTF